MTSRETILQRLESLGQTDIALEARDLEAIQFDDPTRVFTEVSVSVGSRFVSVVNEDSIMYSRDLGEVLPCDGRRVASWVEAVKGNETISNDVDPRQLDGLDVAWVHGALGVAENGAIWIATSDLILRSALFLAEHLVVVLNTVNLVHNMHEAYRELTSRKLLEHATFGTFISGPSKTADIEQSLVIGAQGPCAHTIVLVDASDSA